MSNINNIIRYICEMQSLDQMLQYYYQALVPGHPTPDQLNQILSNPQLMQDLDPTNPQNFEDPSQQSPNEDPNSEQPIQ